MPETVKPPKMVVETLASPIWIPPAEPPVPMAIKVVETPVPILMVEEAPIPRLRVSA